METRQQVSKGGRRQRLFTPVRGSLATAAPGRQEQKGNVATPTWWGETAATEWLEGPQQLCVS